VGLKIPNPLLHTQLMIIVHIVRAPWTKFCGGFCWLELPELARCGWQWHFELYTVGADPGGGCRPPRHSAPMYCRFKRNIEMKLFSYWHQSVVDRQPPHVVFGSPPPGPTGGAHDPLVGWGGGYPLPIPHPFGLWRFVFQPPSPRQFTFLGPSLH